MLTLTVLYLHELRASCLAMLPVHMVAGTRTDAHEASAGSAMLMCWSGYGS